MKLKNIIKYLIFLVIIFSWMEIFVVTEGLTVAKLIGVVTASIWIIYKLATLQSKNIDRRPLGQNRRILFLISLFFTMAVLSGFKVLNLEVYAIRAMQLLLLIGLMVVIYDIIDTKESLKQIIWVMVIAGTLGSLITLFNQIFGQSIIYDIDPTHVGQHIRATGITLDPNETGLQLIMAIPITYYLLEITRQKRIKIFLFMSLCVQFIVTLATFSRGAYLSLLIILFVIFIKERRRAKKFLFLFFASVVIIALSKLIIFTPFISRFISLTGFFAYGSGTYSEGLGSLLQRREILLSGIDMFLSNIFTGVGLGEFRFGITKYGAIEGMTSHNIYLGVAAELGIFGIMLFLAALFLLWRNFSSSRSIFKKVDAQMIPVIDGLQMSFFAFLLGSLFLGTLYTQPLWILAGLSLASLKVASLNE